MLSSVIVLALFLVGRAAIIGANVLRDFVAGVYQRPKLEERIFLVLRGKEGRLTAYSLTGARD